MTTLLEDILEWSNGIPKWQSDVLRMLITAPEMDIDIDEYGKMCISEANNTPIAGLRPTKPLEADHVKGLTNNDQAVSILGIKDLQNINALHPNASLEFGAQGLNVVYGENGTGKSGFGRVLRCSCRCNIDDRKKTIHGNIYQSNQTPPSATIDFQVGATAHSYIMIPGACCEELQAISFFDSDCAPVYVTRENNIAFAPFGLNLLPRLLQVCDQIKKSLVERKANLKVPTISIPKDLEETDSARWFKQINGGETDNDIEAKASFSQNDAETRGRLSRSIWAQDKERNIKWLLGQIARYENAIKRLELLTNALCAEAHTRYAGFSSTLRSAEETNKLVVDDAFKNNPVAHTGSSAWRNLWEAARNFVQNEAYPNASFPAGDGIEYCVLCQQPLGKSDGETRRRLQAFETYVQGEAAKLVDTAQKDIATALEALNQLPLEQDDDASLLQELDDGTSKTLSAFLASAKKIVATCKDSLRTGKWEKRPDLSPAPVQRLRSLIASSRQEVETLRRTNIADERLRMISEYRELEARKLLHDNIEIVKQTRGYHLVSSTLEAAIKSINLGNITKFSTTLTDKHLTEKVRGAFTEKLERLLGGRNLVSLEKTRGKEGETQFQIQLCNAVQDQRVENVVSEGEFRAIALAAFLAELDFAPHKSGIIFDDPVSSMDHTRRKTIAEYMVDLAKERQVMIFTHDLYFMAQLMETAKKEKLGDIVDIQLQGSGTAFGYASKDTPLSIKSFSERCTKIEEKARKAMEHRHNGDEESCRDASFRAGTLMRILAEHIIEHILLCGVVRRFSEGIMSTNPALSKKGLLKIDSDDLDEINRLMDTYSPYLHSRTPADDVPPPDPDSILSDLDRVRKWRKDFNKKGICG